MTVLRWVSDWRNGAVVVASAFVALVAFVTIDASVARNDALEARNRTAASASRRIDLLNDRIEALGDQLAAAAFSNGERIGALAYQVAALQEQVRQLGGEPVIVNQPTTTTTTAPQTTTTTTRPRGRPSTTTTRPCRAPEVAGICIEGAPCPPTSKP